jgi:capsular exopolysaccharide synthesis family protein
VRRGLLYASLDKTLQVLAVSSSVPGEGKSTAAVNLAIAIAREGKRVVLVDCDLRRPVQHRSFPMTANHRGLTEVLTRQVGLEEALQATSVEGLRLLASGAIPADPGRLVESARLGEVIEELRGMADVIIIDTPPVVAVTDAVVLANDVDGVILVIKSFKVARDLVLQAKRQLVDVDARLIGVILNNFDIQRKSYGYYYYYTYYGADREDVGKGRKSQKA